MHLLNVSLNNLLQHVHNCKNSLQAAVLHCQGTLRQEDNATGEHHVLYKGALPPTQHGSCFRHLATVLGFAAMHIPSVHTAVTAIHVCGNCTSSWTLVCSHSLTRPQCTGMWACVHSGPIV